MDKLFNSITILYVEDDEFTTEMIKRRIGSKFLNFHYAKDGKEGLKLYKKYTPEIVITDLYMPNINGLNMAKEMKKISNEVKIIITTAYSQEDYLMEAIDIGIDAYIKKPIEPIKLLDKIKEYVLVINHKKEIEEKNKILINNALIVAKSEILQDIAHHWRQPLNLLAILLQNYQLDLDLGDIKVKEAKNVISKSLDTINSLSSTINFFTTSFKQNPNTKLDIKKLFLNIAELLKATMLDYNIKLNFESEDNLYVYGLKQEFIQVILAILNNAKEAFIINNIENNRLIEINIISVDKNITIEIKDNAGGIKDEIKGEIFNPYFSTKRDMNGTGLGLYIVKIIIEKSLKGTISLESKNNQTVVTVSIPSYCED